MVFLEDDDNDYEETLATYFSIRLPSLEENSTIKYLTISALHDDPLYGYSMNSEMNDHDMHLMFSIGDKNDP